MRGFARIALLACLSVLRARRSSGQYDNFPTDIRAWFKGVMAPNGVPCCDIADDHRTKYDFREGTYWVSIEGQWMAAPGARHHPRSRQSGRPGGGVVRTSPGSIIITCFVPADAV
jgi:hypothetical protein